MIRFFRFLPAITIIFAAGISGAWWSDQFTSPLPSIWGWFGAAIIGVTLWSGVEIAVRGETTGWYIAIVAATMDIIMARLYFASHHPAIAWPMAIAQPLITMLVAYQSALFERRSRAEIEEKRIAEQEELRRRRDAEDRHRRRLERIRLEAELANARSDMRRDEVATYSDAENNDLDFVAWVATQTDGVHVADAARRFGVTRRTIQRRLRRLGYHPNGDGHWHKVHEHG